MKQRIFSVLASLAMVTGMQAERVETLTFSTRINNVRIYNDTLFAATDASVQWVDLNDRRQSGGEVLCVVVYDYLRSGAKRMDVYTDDARYRQHPLNPDRIYRSNPLPDGQMGYTLSRSADFGQTWWTTGLKELELPGRPQIAFNPLDKNEIYVFGVNEFVDCICPWVLHTTDGMETLQPVELQLDEDRPMTTYMQMAFSPTEPGLLLMATTGGMARSVDGGTTWHYTTGGERLMTDVCFDDREPHVAYAVEMLPMALCDDWCHYAVLRSDDDGRSWTPMAEIDFPLFRTGTTTGLCGLQCHKGQLVCWADDHVYLVSTLSGTGRELIPTAIPAVSRPAERTVGYDLTGRRSSASTSGIVIRNGRKFAVK